MLKNLMILLCAALLFTGCGAQETFETVADELYLPAMATPGEIAVDLPQDAVAPVSNQEGEQLYLCRDYEILIETRSAGDVNSTIRALSGYGREDLTVMETQWLDVTRYEFVWACAGEEGDRLGRGVILDDGNYHYCMSVLRDAQGADQIVWDRVFSSFQLV